MSELRDPYSASYPLSALPPVISSVSVVSMTVTITGDGGASTTYLYSWGDGQSTSTTTDAGGHLTVSHTYAGAGTYTIRVELESGATVTVGTVTVPAGTQTPQMPTSIDTSFDPSDWTIANVQTYVELIAALHGDEHDDVVAETQRVLDAERAGSNRSTLIAWLDARLGAV